MAPIPSTQQPPAPMPLLHNAPVQMSITREHTLKLAEKAMDDVSTLIKVKRKDREREKRHEDV